ncbi:hypothetical protein H9L39_01752 [Fusarium oxysporum f. sp. albedinis]|nr:hypothetical protein H9L39_01752 [Fusarium oxysporum f. sp. albedinis]
MHVTRYGSGRSSWSIWFTFRFQSRIYTVAFIYMHLDLDSIQVAGLDERNTQIRKPTASRPWCHSPGIIMHEDVCTFIFDVFILKCKFFLST